MLQYVLLIIKTDMPLDVPIKYPLWNTVFVIQHQIIQNYNVEILTDSRTFFLWCFFL